MSNEIRLESRGEIAMGAFVRVFGCVNELVSFETGFAGATEITFVTFEWFLTSVNAQMFVQAILTLSNVRAMRARILTLIANVGFGHFALDVWDECTYVVFDDIMRARGPDDGDETDSAKLQEYSIQNDTITSAKRI